MPVSAVCDINVDRDRWVGRYFVKMPTHGYALRCFKIEGSKATRRVGGATGIFLPATQNSCLRRFRQSRVRPSQASIISACDSISRRRQQELLPATLPSVSGTKKFCLRRYLLSQAPHRPRRHTVAGATPSQAPHRRRQQFSLSGHASCYLAKPAHAILLREEK